MGNTADKCFEWLGLCCHLRKGMDLCALSCCVWAGNPPEVVSVKSERGFPARSLQRLQKVCTVRGSVGALSCSQSNPRKSFW